jgi:hypothetical protein
MMAGCDVVAVTYVAVGVALRRRAVLGCCLLIMDERPLLSSPLQGQQQSPMST